MFRKLFIVVGLLLSPLCSFAQSGREQTRSEVTLNDGVKLSSQLKDSKTLAITYYHLEHAFSDLNLFPQAIESYEKSKEAFDKPGPIRNEIYVLADLGALYFIQEDYKRARECSETSLHIAENENINATAGMFPDDVGKAQ